MDNATRSAYILAGVTFLIACIPGVGFLTWFIAGPVFFVTFILAIIALSRGATREGINILIVTLILGPLGIVIAPLATTALLGKAVADRTASPAESAPHYAQPVATPVPLPTGPAVEAAKKRAVVNYPEIGKAGSPANAAFLELVRRAQVERPAIFEHPEWPSLLAGEAVKRVR